MKNLLIGCAIGLGVVSCTAPRMRANASGGQEIKTPGNRLTYCIINCAYEGWDSTAVSPGIHAAIDRHLTMLGYDAFRAESPYQPVADVFVYCSVHQQDQPILEFHPITSGQEVKYRKSKKILSGGSLVIQLFDTHSERLFWLGYASNLKVEERFSEPELLSMAAARIIDGFRISPTPRYLNAEVAPSFVWKK